MRSIRPCTGWRFGGCSSSDWGTSENNRRAKFYRLTAEGRKQLAQEAGYWERMTAGVARIMETT